VRRFVVDRVTLNLSVEGQPLRTTLYNMAFHGSVTVDPLHIRTTMLEGQGEVAYSLGSRRLQYHLSQQTAGVDLVKNRLTVEHLRVEAPEFTITGHGILRRGQVAAEFNLDLASAALSALMPEVPTPTGMLSARGSLAGHLDAPQLRVSAEGPRLTLGPYAASDLIVNAQMAGSSVNIEHFGLGVATGTIQGTGTLNLTPRRIALHVDLADLSLAALSSLLDHSLPTLDGKLGGQVHLESPSFDVEHLQASRQLSLMARAASQQPTPSASPLPWPFRLTADFRFAAGTLTLRQTAWAMDGFKGQVSGTQSLDDMTQLSGTPDANLTAPIFRSLGLQGIHGNMQATFGLQGRLADPRVTAEIQVQQARYRGFAMDHLRLAVDAEGAEVTIRSLTGVQDQAGYHLHGALTLASPFSRSHRPLGVFPIRAIRELQLQIEQADLTALASLLPMPIPLAGALTLHASGAGT